MIGGGAGWGFAGFFSKDAVIEYAYSAGAHGSSTGVFAFAIGIIAALLTSFYSWRLIFMTFHGKFRGDHHTLDHAHESPLSMLIPLGVLSAGAIFAGAAFYAYFMGDNAYAFWNYSLPIDAKDHALIAPSHLYAAAGETYPVAESGNWLLGTYHGYPRWVLLLPLLVSALGFVTAYLMYIKNGGTERRISEIEKTGGGPLYRFLLNKWYIDEIYDATVVRATKGLGDLFWKRGDIGIIDRFGPDGVAAVAMASAKRLAKFQSGYLFHYAFVMLLGVAAILALVFRTVGG